MSSHNTLESLLQAEYCSPDPGVGKTLQLSKAFAVFHLVSADTETSSAKKRTLSLPDRSGLEVMLNMQADAGDILVTVTGGYDAAGNTDITFNDVGDWVRLVSVCISATSFRWRIVQSQGVTGTGIFDVSTKTLTADSLTATTIVAAAGGTIGITDGQVAAGAGAATLTFKTSTASPSSLTQAGWIPVKVGGTTVYVPYFSATV